MPGPGGSVGEIEIEYDGLEPPLALFAELAVAGWTAPVPVPPPSDAIDWTRADHVTGKRYSVRPYRATGRSRPATRAAFGVEQVRALIERHRHVAAPLDVVPPMPSSPSLDEVSPATSVVIATLPPERVDALVNANPRAEVLRRTPTTRRVVGHYRGRQSEIVLPAIEVELRADANALRTLLQTLQDVDDVQVRPLR